MNACKICGCEFTPKRKEQLMCSIKCRQSNNAHGRKGQKTGRHLTQYKQRLTKDGHLRMYAAKHPYANGRKEIPVHVMIMERHIGRSLRIGECVHHANGIKADNRLENLRLETHSNHSSSHMKEIVKSKKRGARGRFA